MKIICDSKEAQQAIESLCHNAMRNCERTAFTQNLAFVISVLSAVEIETPEPQLKEPEEPTVRENLTVEEPQTEPGP